MFLLIFFFSILPRNELCGKLSQTGVSGLCHGGITGQDPQPFEIDNDALATPHDSIVIQTRSRIDLNVHHPIVSCFLKPRTNSKQNFAGNRENSQENSEGVKKVFFLPPCPSR